MALIRPAVLAAMIYLGYALAFPDYVGTSYHVVVLSLIANVDYKKAVNPKPVCELCSHAARMVDQFSLKYIPMKDVLALGLFCLTNTNPSV